MGIYNLPILRLDTPHKQWGIQYMNYQQIRVFLPITVSAIKVILALDYDAGCDPLGATPETNHTFMIWNKNIPVGGGDQSDVQWFVICTA